MAEGREFHRVLVKNKGQSRRPLLVQSKTQQKSFFFLLEEKIRRAQNKKSKEYFSVVWRTCQAVAEQAFLVGFCLKKVRISVKKTN